MASEDEHTMQGARRRARLTTELLRDELLTIGVSEDEAEQVDARVGSDGDAYIHLPDLTTTSADRLLAALCCRRPTTVRPEVS